MKDKEKKASSQQNNSLSKEDIELFRNAIKGTRELKILNNAQPFTTNKPKAILRKKPQENFILSDPLPDHSNLPPVGSEQIISYFHSSLSSPIQRKLKRGDYPIEATLDLHGHTSETAKQHLIAFIHHCVTQEIRHIIIVHGKGRENSSSPAILKNKVNFWLREHPQILAFHSGLPKHGGTGAVYVLLKSI